MSDYISCYNENKELEHFEVPEPVYVYIVQLENEIKYASGGCTPEGKYWEARK